MDHEMPVEVPTLVDTTLVPRPVVPQADGGCTTCGPAAAPAVLPPSFVYAIGRVEPRFPSIGMEKEFAQATGRADTQGLTDRQATAEILGQHRYLARGLCYVLTIGGLDTYLLRPRDPMDLDVLIEAIRPRPSPMDLDTVVGTLGPLAPPDLCNGLVVPVVVFDQLYSFDRATLRTSMPRPDSIPEDQFLATADELLDRIMQIADNAGATDEDRALNYLAMRYERIYAVTADAFARGASLNGVDVRPARIAGARVLMDVVFTFTDRSTDVDDSWSVRVDVTEEYPFLVTKLAPFLQTTNSRGAVI
jgi:hypothetical protein